MIWAGVVAVNPLGGVIAGVVTTEGSKLEGTAVGISVVEGAGASYLCRVGIGGVAKRADALPAAAESYILSFV
ncbi:hypothetical protein V7075_16590 [Neobacillus drentensis]|uniref:hypothetical protein n=1 Tax=Neobacillus drentensis TaxID=220684 RepID=UPI003000C8E9